MIYRQKLYRHVARNEAYAQKLVDKILRDTETLAQHSENIDEWIERLGLHITTARYEDDIMRIAEEAAKGTVAANRMKPGVQVELVKSMVREDVQGYFQKLMRVYHEDLRGRFLEAYDARKPPLEFARDLTKQVSGMTDHRARTIARTETMRASNLAEYARGVYEKGFQAFRVTSAQDCCKECAEVYQYGETVFRADETDMMPPLHPNCRCTVAWLPLSETPPEFLENPIVPNMLLGGGLL